MIISIFQPPLPAECDPAAPTRTVPAVPIHPAPFKTNFLISPTLLLKRVPKDIILCVDDEPIVLRACTIAVVQAGFRAVVAENGAAGLETFLHLNDEICLVLADIIMPGMNGIEMAESILQVAPSAKILLMSGYSDDVIERQGRNRFPFIRKPFIFVLLIQKIRSVLKLPGGSTTAGV